MKRRTRYLFIGLGFLVFGIISPLIVLYVSGFSYDWETDQLSATGLLSVKTEPGSAAIFLDGEKVGTSAATIRFLKPKDYEVRITKEGYFDWSKRLNLQPGKVTWASDKLPELHLIRRDPAPVIAGEEVRDFALGNNFALYLTGSELVKTDLGKSAIVESARLSGACEKITVSPSQKLAMLKCGVNSYLYNQTDLSPVRVSLLPDQPYEFGPDDALYHLDGRRALIKTDSETGVRTEIGSGITAFSFQGNSLYRLQNSGGGTGQALVISPLYSPAQTQTLMDSLPDFKAASLFISRPKEVFIYADNNMYRVNEQLELLQSGIKEVGFDSDSPALAYTTGFELFAYDFSRGRGQLVVRQTGAITMPEEKLDLGYVLYLNDNKIHATEMDSRDRVNSYQLATGAEIKKYTVDPSHRIVYFLDGGTLKFFRLR